MEKDKKTNLHHLEKKYQAYPLQPVPRDLRANWFRLSLVWFGFIQCTTNLLSGATIGQGRSLSSAILAILIGNGVLCVIALVQGLLSQETGYSTYYLLRFSFGNQGARFISLLISISFIGWAGVGIGIAAETLVSFIPLSKQLLALICSILFSITAIFGFKGMEHLSKITIPTVYFISIFGMFSLMQTKDLSFQDLWNIAPLQPMPFASAVAVTIGSWIAGTIAAPDINRFAKSKKDIAISSVLTFIVGNSFLFIIGAMLATASSTWNLPTLLSQLGFGFFGLILILFLAWSVADNDYYAAGLSLSNTLNNKHSLIPTLICVAAGTIVAVWGIYDYFYDYLIILGYIFPPVGGIMMVDYLFYRNKYSSKTHLDNYPINWLTAAIWAISIFLSIVLDEFSSPVVGLCASIILYAIFSKLIKNK